MQKSETVSVFLTFPAIAGVAVTPFHSNVRRNNDCALHKLQTLAREDPGDLVPPAGLFPRTVPDSYWARAPEPSD